MFAEQAIEFQLEHVEQSVAAIYNRDVLVQSRSYRLSARASGPEPPVGFSEKTSGFGRKPVRRHLVIQIGK